MADDFSKFSKTTAIYLARIGVDGTSGSHVSRKTVLERRLMNAALDALKERYGFEGFHLAGQSGGSLLVAALIEMRRDIACAVLGSAPLSTPGSCRSRQQPAFFSISAIRPRVAGVHIPSLNCARTCRSMGFSNGL